MQRQSVETRLQGRVYFEPFGTARVLQDAIICSVLTVCRFLMSFKCLLLTMVITKPKQATIVVLKYLTSNSLRISNCAYPTQAHSFSLLDYSVITLIFSGIFPQWLMFWIAFPSLLLYDTHTQWSHWRAFSSLQINKSVRIKHSRHWFFLILLSWHFVIFPSIHSRQNCKCQM